jgi:N-acetylglutamate synthase-like GNAT family acetyltransferase
MAGIEYTLRPAKKTDLPEIRRLLRRCGLRLKVLKWSRFTVAESGDDKIVGCAQIKHRPRRPDEIASVAVDPACRHQGIAGNILERLIAAGTRPIYIFNRPDLAAFYGRFGFVWVRPDEIPAHYLPIQAILRIKHRLFKHPKWELMRLD